VKIVFAGGRDTFLPFFFSLTLAAIRIFSIIKSRAVPFYQARVWEEIKHSLVSMKLKGTDYGIIENIAQQWAFLKRAME